MATRSANTVRMPSAVMRKASLNTRKVGEIGNAVHVLNTQIRKIAQEIMEEIYPGKGCKYCQDKYQGKGEEE